MQAFEDPISTAGYGVCLHLAPHTRTVEWCILRLRVQARSDSPQPGEDVGRQHSDTSAGCDPGQIALRTGLPVREHISANHNGDQAGNLGDSSGEQGLERRESGIEG